MIFVIKDGAIVERGKHNELLKAGGLYSHLDQLQHKEEEAGFRAPEPQSTSMYCRDNLDQLVLKKSGNHQDWPTTVDL